MCSHWLRFSYFYHETRRVAVFLGHTVDKGLVIAEIAEYHAYSRYNYRTYLKYLMMTPVKVILQQWDLPFLIYNVIMLLNEWNIWSKALTQDPLWEKTKFNGLKTDQSLILSILAIVWVGVRSTTRSTWTLPLLSISVTGIFSPSTLYPVPGNILGTNVCSILFTDKNLIFSVKSRSYNSTFADFQFTLLLAKHT